jgi:hypothetical protein
MTKQAPKYHSPQHSLSHKLTNMYTCVLLTRDLLMLRARQLEMEIPVLMISSPILIVDLSCCLPPTWTSNPSDRRLVWRDAIVDQEMDAIIVHVITKCPSDCIRVWVGAKYTANQQALSDHIISGLGAFWLGLRRCTMYWPPQHYRTIPLQ